MFEMWKGIHRTFYRTELPLLRYVEYPGKWSYHINSKADLQLVWWEIATHWQQNLKMVGIF